jgi:hypothetical protein
MDADGSGQTNLTNSPGDDWYGDWQARPLSSLPSPKQRACR